MALPFLMFIVLLFVAGTFLFIGINNAGLGAGFIFILAASVVLIVTGSFLFSEGLELPIVDNVVEAGFGPTTTSTVNYQTLQNTDGSALFVISNFIFFSGFVLIILSFLRTVTGLRSQCEAQEEFI